MGDIVFFIKRIDIPPGVTVTNASLYITTDNGYYVYVNNPYWCGTPVVSDGFASGYYPTNFYEVVDGNLYPKERVILPNIEYWGSIEHENESIADLLQPGENWLQIVGINEHPRNAKKASSNRAGLIYKLEVSYEPGLSPPQGSPAVPLTDPPPLDLDVSIPPFVPTPIQAAWYPDINNDGRIDLVLGKPMAILVNVSGTTSDISVTVEFEEQEYTLTNSSPISNNSILTFYDPPIIPQSIGDKDINGTYTNSSGTFDLTTVGVTVKNTSDLSMSYYYLYRVDRKGKLTDYETVSLEDFNDNVGNSTLFFNATYPIANLTVDGTYEGKGIAGAKNNKRDPYWGIYQDAMAAAEQALLDGYAIGIAIGPNVTGADKTYFEYHGLPTYVGMSFGQALMGAVSQEGYYVVNLHEHGHALGLKTEEYLTDPPWGIVTSGVWVTEGEWVTGVCIMGAAPYRTLNYTWIHPET
ncbi:MAG: hypothetical protein GTN80_00855, partial [Nitrososphaeria archaeon]|nr:hypothetical protein [Nitrososphaeria archaeon]NIQ32195.1 hypothetical protein [Nitrososphaeria archaeon]